MTDEKSDAEKAGEKIEKETVKLKAMQELQVAALNTAMTRLIKILSANTFEIDIPHVNALLTIALASAKALGIPGEKIQENVLEFYNKIDPADFGIQITKATEPEESPIIIAH